MSTSTTSFVVVGDINLSKKCRKTFTRLYGYKSQLNRIKKLISHLNKTKPEFVIFLGNIIYSHNPQKRQKIIHHFQKELEKLKITYYMLPGKIDLYNKTTLNRNPNYDIGNFLNSIQQFKQDFNTTEKFAFYKNSTQLIGLTSEYWAANFKELMNGEVTNKSVPEIPQ